MKALFFILVAFLLSSAAATSQIEETEVQASIIINPSLFITPTNISSIVLPFSFLEKNLTFRQNTNFDINVSLQSEGAVADWLSFSATNFTIAPSQTRNVTVFLEIPDTAAGAYKGNITANGLVVPVEIAVTNRYKLNSSLAVEPSGIQLGENITVFATIGKEAVGKVKGVEGRIPIMATYEIRKSRQFLPSYDPQI